MVARTFVPDGQIMEWPVLHQSHQHPVHPEQGAGAEGVWRARIEGQGVARNLPFDTPSRYAATRWLIRTNGVYVLQATLA